jgi:hypothetical protein
LIEKWKGTVVIDEADYKYSDESQDIIKLINQGYEKGKHIMRCDQNDASKINFFDCYCPKIIATRKPFVDKATESRCITTVMKGTRRKDINVNINQSFWDDAKIIRNKLLMYRFKMYYNIDPDMELEFDIGDIEPRVKQIVKSFISLFSNDQEQLEKFKKFITQYQSQLIEERRDTMEGQIVGAIIELIEDGVIHFAAKDIIEKGNFTNKEGTKPMQPRAITKWLKALALHEIKVMKIEGKPKRVIKINPNHLENLCKRYGYGVTVVTVLCESCDSNISENLSLSPPHHNNRNNRNSVTNENLKFSEEKINSTRNEGKKNRQELLDLLDKHGEIEVPEKLEEASKELKFEGVIFEVKPGRVRYLK